MLRDRVFALLLVVASLGLAPARASDPFSTRRDPAAGFAGPDGESPFQLRPPLEGPAPSAAPDPGLAAPRAAGREREEVVPQIAHVNEILQIAVAPGGAYVVTSGRDGFVKQWTPDGRLLRTYPGPALLNSVAFAPDGRTLAIGTLQERDIHLRASTGELLRRFAPELKTSSGWPHLAFGPDGSWLAICSGSWTAECRVVDVMGRQVRVLPLPPDPGGALGVVVGPDGSVYAAVAHGLVAWAPDGTPRWHASTGSRWVQRIALSPDGATIAAVAGERPNWPRMPGQVPVPGALSLWDTAGTRRAELPWHESGSLSFTPDGARVVSGGARDGRVWILDRATRSVSRLALGGPGRLSPACVAPAADGSLLVAAETDRPATPRIFDLEGRRLGRFAGAGAQVTAVALDPKGKLIVTTASDGKVRFFSLDGTLLRRFDSGEEYPANVAVEPRGRFVVTGAETLVAWDGQGKAVARAKLGKAGMSAIAFTPDGRALVAGTYGGEILFVPLAPDGRRGRVRAWKGHRVDAVAVDPSGTLLAAGGGGNAAVVVGVDGRVRATLDPPTRGVGLANGVAFLRGGKEILVASGAPQHQLAVYDLEGTLLRSVDTTNRFLSGGMALSPSGDLVAVTVGTGVGLYDPSTLQRKALLRGHRNHVVSMAFTSDERHLVTGSLDGTVRVWNLATGDSAALFSSGDEWVIFTDDGYFDGSRRASDLLAVVVGTEGFGVDQVALRRNRPDLIYRRLGLADEAQLEHLAAHHAARLREAGLDASAELPATLRAPRVRIASHARDATGVALELEVADAEDELASLQIWANGVPLLDGEGRPLEGRGAKLRERVELAQGRNRIEVAARNRAGVESRRATLLLERKIESRPVLWFVGLGVSRYRDPRLDLHVAHRDPQLLAAALRRGGSRYAAVKELVLQDAEVTRGALERIRSFLAPATVDDTVVLLASGHGTRDPSARATFQFVSHEADVADVRGTTIALDELEGLLAGTKARSRLLLLDACQSGDVDPSTLEKIRAQAAASGLSVRLSPGRDGVSAVPRTYLAYRDRYAYVHLQRETGVVRFTSSLGTEVSVESEKLGSGLFTAALVRALGAREVDRNHDGWISIGELETAVKLFVGTASNGIQHPSVDRENPLQDLRLPLLR